MDATVTSNAETGKDGRKDFSGFVFAGLLAASFFLIQAGVIEILLSRNATCLANAGQLRIGLLPEEICMPEWQYLLLTGAANGVVGIFLRGVQWLAWLINAAIYFLIGMGVTQLSRRTGVTVFIIAYLFMSVIGALLAYVSQYIL